MLVCSSTKSQQQQQVDKKPRPQPDQALKCPRCDSTNTKFCYYNNYSLSQPRYFCKSCRRYWTKGGTLRNVPVGGGCRKNKRSSSSSSSSSSSAAAAKSKSHQDQHHHLHHQSGVAVPINGLPPHLGYDTNDLSLAFARLQKQSSSMGFHDHDFSMLAAAGNNNNNNNSNHVIGNPSLMTSSPATTTTTTSAFLDALSRSNFMGGTQNGNFIQNAGFYSNGFGGGGEDGFDHHQQQQQDQQEQINGMSSSIFEDHATVACTTMKQEISSCDGNSRVLWGFPWQQLSGSAAGISSSSSDHHHLHHHLGLGPAALMSDLDTARESWNNSTNFNSAWHGGGGLLNTPLM